MVDKRHLLSQLANKSLSRNTDEISRTSASQLHQLNFIDLRDIDVRHLDYDEDESSSSSSQDEQEV
jgi:hypothetical protein